MENDRNRGFALVIVLWAGVLLSVIAASFAFSMRVETRLAGNLVERAQAQALADAGIQRGILALLANSPGSPSGLRWVADGRLYTLPLGAGSMHIRLISENGKVDLNGAPEALIAGLLSSLAQRGELSDPQQAAQITAAILDWRDSDQRVRPGGAEDADYRASGQPFGARDGAFLSVAELNLIRGVDAGTYARLAPWLTVYSWAPQVDPMTAPREVLLAIPGLDAGRVDSYIAARDAFYAGQPEQAQAATRLPLEQLSPGARYLSRSDSKVYTVEAVGELPGGARASRRVVVQMTGDARNPYAIVAWFDSIPDSESRADKPE